MDAFTTELKRLGAAADAEAAARFMQATLAALGARLDSRHWHMLVAAAPAELRSTLTRAPQPGTARLDALAAEVAAACGLSVGHALEAMELVCELLGRALGPDAREAVRLHLPDELAPLFAPRPIPAARAGEHTPSGHPPEPARETLASGRPGSHHPLSESNPDRAQHGSVASWEATRTERTLGGYRGDERVREGEALATGKPGSSRPVSGGDGSGKR